MHLLSAKYSPMQTAVAGVRFHRRLSVCLYLKNRCSHRITKYEIQMFPDESWKPTYLGVKRSKVKVTSQTAWVFVLF